MRLNRKLPLMCAGILLAATCAGGFGIYQLHAANASYAHLIEVELEHERAVSDILAQFKTQVQEWKNTLIRGKDEQQRQKYWNAFLAQDARVQAAARHLSTALGQDEASQVVANFADAHAKLSQRYQDAYRIFTNADFDPRAGDRAVQGMDRDPAALLDSAHEQITAHVNRATASAKATSRRAAATSLALLAVVCAVGTLAAMMLARAIATSINTASQIVQRVAGGDLSSQVDVRGNDEIADLMTSLATMNQGLRTIVRTVRGASQTIAVGSGQIAAGGADLARRTEHQANSLKGTAASLGNLNITVKQNVDHALQADQLAQGASKVAVKGGEVVGQVVETMKQINESSRRIADIIGVIDGIAFQTNILALNAAVEAARAGEEGRGFAVVAGEVRTLAQRSAEAAKEIRSLIAASVSRVDHGSQLVDQAGATMNEIVDSISRVTMIMGEITQASSEQNAGVAQVGEAVSQMDQSTQQNAALVEQSSAAAASLRDQAQHLVNSVATFKVDAGDSRPRRAAATAPTAPTAPKATTKAPPSPGVALAPAPRAVPTPPTAPPTLTVEADHEWETF